MQWIDREGIFRGRPVAASIYAAKDSASVGLEVDVQIEEALVNGEWQDWREYAMGARGTIWFIGKTGAVNMDHAETARDVLGWSGDLEDVNATAMNPCQINVKTDTYNGKTKFKIAFFNPYDSQPNFGASADELRTLKAKHGSKLRAVFGAKSHAAPKAAASKPPAPPAPAAAPAAADTATAEVTAANKDQAWGHVIDAYPGKTDDERAQIFYGAIDKIAKKVGRDEAAFTADDWTAVANDALIPF